MDLSTQYMGLQLKNPLVPSSSPLMTSLDNIKLMEEAGAAAVVLHSLFEEQITEEALQMHYIMTQGTESYAESLSYFPEPREYKFSDDEYLEYIRKVKAALSIPVIGSLNGVTSGGWLSFARLMQQAGADAIELNLYFLPSDPVITDQTLLNNYVEIVRRLKREITIPLGVKLSPFFTSLPAAAKALTDAGAEGLSLFNRFYQPDLDIEKREVRSSISLSQSSDIRLAMRWIAILHGRINASLAATGGVHTAEDVIKLVMAGADVTMMASVLLQEGIESLKHVLFDLENWLISHEYESINQMKGSLSLRSAPNPAAYERALYLKELTRY